MQDDPLVDVLRATVEALENAGISYAVTGSVAGSIHGEPIQSLDVEIVLRMTPEQARQVATTLPQRFFRSAEHLEKIARKGGIANLIDTDSSLKVDLSVLPVGEFYDSVLSRRALLNYGPDAPCFYTVTAEDIILMKLDWRRDSKSQKQWDNALGVVRVQGARLDWKYLFEYARKLELEEDLIALRDEGGV